SGCADRGENAQAALEIRDRHQHLALDGALGRVDIGDCDRSILNQRPNLSQCSTENASHMRLLVLVSESHRFGEIVFLEELGELGGELARLTLRLAKIPPLLDGD